MADKTQTQKDTERAASRVTRSAEYQKRVDDKAKEAAKSKTDRGQATKQPTAEEARKARNDKNRTERTQKDTDKAQSRITRSGEYQRRIDAASNPEQVGSAAGNISFTSSRIIASGGGGLSGIEIIWADQTETFIKTFDMLAGYDADTDSYWSAVFAVSNNTFTQATPTYDATSDLWDDVGTDQTKYRLRLVTQGVNSANASISMYGQYRESILCVSGDPVTVLVKIS